MDPGANLHLTLWFIGEVPTTAAAGVIERAATAADESGVRLRIGGFGAFPPSGAPRVFWLGVADGHARQLAELHAELGVRLRAAAASSPRARGRIRAHLTLARVKELRGGAAARGGLAPSLARRSRLTAGNLPRVDAITVFREPSSPKRRRSYEPLLRVPL